MKRLNPSTSALAVLGLVAVLGVLTAAAVTASVRTKHTADRAAGASALNEAFVHARYNVMRAELLERKYRLEPSPLTLANWRAAQQSLITDIERVKQLGGPKDVAIADDVLALHRRYVAASLALFRAVDAHDDALAQKIDHERLDPPFRKIGAWVNAESAVQGDKADSSLGAVQDTTNQVLLQTPLVFALGLLLIVVFASVLTRRRRRAETDMRKAEEKFRTLVESLPLVSYIATVPSEQPLVYVSPQIEAILGVSVDDLLGAGPQLIEYVHPDDRERLRAVHRTLGRPGESVEFEYRLLARDGRIVWVQDAAVAEAVGPDGFVQMRGYLIDITKRIEAEHRLHDRDEQLRQSQKLEAVGQLAGGVAHDFNNLLTAIGGYCRLLRRHVSRDSEALEYVDQVSRASERAAELTNQLLVFSRKKVLRRQVICAAVVVQDLEPMLRRLIKENIELVIDVGHDLGAVRFDTGQLEQVIMNLVVNAQDAMPDGGSISISAEDAECAHPETGEPTRYLRLSVCDTGAGIDGETRERIFEPFFTTKPPGEGTGLGLSTVYAIVEQSQGFVTVDSELGRGSTFAVYVPVTDEAISAPEPVQSQLTTSGGDETILLVEDEDAIRPLVRRMLEEFGYTVLVATDGEDALEVAEGYDGDIDLMLTDVVMPKMGGRELRDRIASDRPEMGVLFTSGYTDDAVVQQGVNAGQTFLQKPFSMVELGAKVRQVLDARPTAVTR